MKLTVLPQKIEIQVEKGVNLLKTLKENNIFIKNSCGGCASCSHCVVVIESAESSVNGMSFEETQILGNTFHITKERLSCQTTIEDNLVIDVTSHIQPVKKTITKVRKAQEVAKIKEERYQEKLERPKKLGGGKRPKAFNYSESEEDKDEH